MRVLFAYNNSTYTHIIDFPRQSEGGQVPWGGRDTVLFVNAPNARRPHFITLKITVLQCQPFPSDP